MYRIEGLRVVSSAQASNDINSVNLQVYRARLRATGEEVAVKVQRPDALSTISKVPSCRSQCLAAARSIRHACMA